MLKQHKKIFRKIFYFLDIFIIISTFYVFYYFESGLLTLDPTNLQIQYIIYVAAYMVVWLYISKNLGLYDSKRQSEFIYEALNICKSCLICFLVGILSSFLITENHLGRMFFLHLWPLQVGTLIIFRLAVRETLKYIRRRGYNYRQVLIAGRNGRAMGLARDLSDSLNYGLRVLGFIDVESEQTKSLSNHEFRLLGNVNHLEQILRDYVVDEVYICLPIKSFYSEIKEILVTCEKAGIETKIPADFFDTNLAKSHISHNINNTFIYFCSSPRMDWRLMIKRFEDIIISLVLLIFLCPLFGIVGLLIKTTSKGPVFFKQLRIGYNGRLFTLLKFRTMVENAEDLRRDLVTFNEMDGPVFKLSGDPRITKIGRVLRRSSIDELPQIINVLKGDMSLVGPRPSLPDEVSHYNLEDRRRLSMKPGITCLWQVSGRNGLSFQEWMELDRYYVDRWSLWLDFKILLRTIPAVFKGTGAV